MVVISYPKWYKCNELCKKIKWTEEHQIPEIKQQNISYNL